MEPAIAFVVSLVLVWMAWSLTRGEWIPRGTTNPGRLAHDIMDFARALCLAVAGFLVIATYSALRMKVSNLEVSAVPRSSLTSWYRLRFSIWSPLVFLFAYLNVLILIAICGVAAKPRHVSSRLVDFWLFWHDTDSIGLSLVTSILWINVLAAVFLWLSFRSYRSSIRKIGVVLYLPYVLALLFLFIAHGHFYKIAQEPPERSSSDQTPLLFPSSTTDASSESAGEARLQALGPLEPGREQEPCQAGRHGGIVPDYTERMQTVAPGRIPEEHSLDEDGEFTACPTPTFRPRRRR